MTVDDAATMHEEFQREAALAEQASRAQKSRIEPIGCCHLCGDEVGPEALFCDTVCRNRYQLESDARKRNGV